MPMGERGQIKVADWMTASRQSTGGVAAERQEKRPQQSKAARLSLAVDPKTVVGTSTVAGHQGFVAKHADEDELRGQLRRQVEHGGGVERNYKIDGCGRPNCDNEAECGGGG